MPNLSFNRLTLSGARSDVDACFAAMQPTATEAEKHGCSVHIDFNRILPLPDMGQFIPASNAAGKSIFTAWWHRWNDRLANEKEIAYRRNQEEQWVLEHWGAHNSIEHDDSRDGDALCFLTSYDAPIPLVQHLSEMYPTLRLTLEWIADWQACSVVYAVGRQESNHEYTLQSSHGKAIAHRCRSGWTFDSAEAQQ